MHPLFAVTPADLYRAATELRDEAPAPAAPDPDTDPGWAVTAALGTVTAAVTDRLAALAAVTAAGSDALREAARSYETADARPGMPPADAPRPGVRAADPRSWVPAGHELDGRP
jgi:hypothetical protein